MALIAVAPLAAQPAGIIHGEVLDRTGDTPLRGVHVELLLAEGPSRLAVTLESGAFRFEGVPTGAHRVRIRYLGYHPLTREVEVAPGEAVRLRLELTTTALDLDTLRVLASPLTIRRRDTEFTARIERRAMELLPTPYEPGDMVILTPGASPGRIWGGAADEANLYQLDGMAQTHPGGGGPLIPVSPVWLQAVEVRGLGAGAEHGNFQGGIVNALTRTGTNLREAGFRTSIEHSALNATNVVAGEVGRDRSGRSEILADAGGPIVRDRLFYFLGGHALSESIRAQSRMREFEERFLPHEEERLELRGFGKLTWTPSSADRIDLSAGVVTDRTENRGLDGYQTEAAAGRRSAPSGFYQLAWERGGEGTNRFEVRVAGSEVRDRTRPDRGPDVPGVRLFAHDEIPRPTYRNAPFRVEQEAGTHTFLTSLARRVATGPMVHDLQIGAEVNRSSWSDVRLRSGGLTWRPPRSSSFDSEVPSTWFLGSILPVDWGGEVDLHAEMGSEAIYAQIHTFLHPRLSVSPGVRLARWRGDLLPGGDASLRIEALRTSGVEPRVGITVDPFGTNAFVLKAHWGRYHQNLLATLFERTEGGDVFSNREMWYYRGAPFSDPGTTFTPAERDARRADFSLQQQIRLNETGPVADGIRQPHVDQWLVAAERTFGPRFRLEALWVDRTNRNMVALQDANMEANYHRYDAILVRDLTGEPLGFNDGIMRIPSVYVPNDWIRQILIWMAEGPSDLFLPPGFVLADTLHLSFDPQMELRNVPEATRKMRQLQLSAHTAFPTWGGSVSLVLSRLRGNFNSVSGYEAGTGFENFAQIGAGPFVRPNEQVNFQGRLPGLSQVEFKFAAYGELPGSLTGGFFLHAARGERFTPYFTLNGFGFEYYVENEGAAPLRLDPRLVHAVGGQRVFLQERGEAGYEDRVTLDLRLERVLPVGGGRWRATIDLFNLWNGDAVTRINPSMNHSSERGSHPLVVQDPSAVFLSVWERVPPRTLRIGLRGEW